jgi:hypothetical protein
MYDAAPAMGFCLSQDLGKIGDYHASILTETIFQVRSRTTFKRKIYQPGDVEVIYPEIHVRGVSRSQVSYDKLVEWTKVRLSDYRLVNNCWHVVDASGVGQSVLDFMRANNLSPVGIYATGGDIVNQRPYGYTVPKTELIASFQTVMSRGLLHIPEKLDPAIKKQLIHEVQNYKEKITRANNSTFEAWREKDHDDLISSLMLNCWWVMRMNGQVIETNRHKPMESDYNPLRYGL